MPRQIPFDTVRSCGLWFVVCGLWFVVCGLWFVVFLDDGIGMDVVYANAHLGWHSPHAPPRKHFRPIALPIIGRV